jgi:aldose 1-epimerase
MNFAARRTGQPKSARSGRHFSTSGWVTPGIVGMICLALLAAAVERGRGNFQKLVTKVNPPAVVETAALPAAGGQEPIHLTRSATSIGSDAEMLSVTLLPGRGMNVFQITAMVPGHGEVPLLASPPLTDAVNILNGKNGDANGMASTTLGGAFLLPWAQSLSGNPTSTPGMLETDWDGKRLTFPAANPDGTTSVEGLLLNAAADNVKSDVLPDGQSALATFHVRDFNGKGNSNIEVKVLAELTAHDVDFTVTAQNTGSQPAPFGIGWHPFFALPSGDRSNALLTIPSQTIMDVDRRTGLPTGKTVEIDDTARDYSHIRGTKLGNAGINDTYTSLQSTMGTNPIAELTDPAFSMRLRIIPMTPNVNSMRVIAPANRSWVSIGPNTNLDDPLGPEWGGPQNAGIVTLAPGQTIRWKVRVEISLLGSAESVQ